MRSSLENLYDAERKSTPVITHIKAIQSGYGGYLNCFAEREGFEPSNPCGLAV